MKSYPILILFLVSIQILKAQCSTNDCVSIPITDGCERYCNSLTIILKDATEAELKFIVGMDSEAISQILEARSEDGVIDINNLEVEFDEATKNKIVENLSSLNDSQTDYFNLEENDRRKVNKQLEKIELR